MEGMAGKKSSLTWAVHISAFLLVVLWTIPTLGLFVSSFRDRDQISSGGWWASFLPSERTGYARTGTDDDARQVDGLYVIEGLVTEGDQKLSAWGTGAREPGKYQPGETVEIEDGWQLTVSEDGSYRLTSEKPFGMRRGERIFTTTATPPDFTTGNYHRVLTAEGLGRAFMNTLTVTIPATVIPILIAAFAAYALAWMRFPGRALLTAGVVGLLVVPLQVALIPLLQMHNAIGIGKGYMGIWLAHTAFGLPLAVYLLRNYMIGLPREVIESARVDGASDFQIFRRIVLPLSFPALASFAIFQFLWVWNDLLVATVFLGNTREQLVMTGVLRELMGSKGGEWEILATSAFVSIAVPLIVFFSMQRYLVRGLLAGSVKGG
ncbi:carbohydrate ABC transporter permease [Paracoccus onubensis]|uniref:carbohydrate ABC transporter permease n=1 Tax=Paracoccus onubensis TaxID=1675788 RepID=UPI0027300934|nr:carbohydrate ABC transporter permease [Paracoccus onubensis]MDP0930109.1 carbohydrate ABC transporter permease [Paracoccus onubensis]